MPGLQKHLVRSSHKLERRAENTVGNIAQVTLSEFIFSETEPRQLFLCCGTPCQMLIGNVTSKPHLQGDVYLKCNQGKASLHQQTLSLLINPSLRAEEQTL